jgi:hypothetical protein
VGFPGVKGAEVRRLDVDLAPAVGLGLDLEVAPAVGSGLDMEVAPAVGSGLGVEVAPAVGSGPDDVGPDVGSLSRPPRGNDVTSRQAGRRVRAAAEPISVRNSRRRIRLPLISPSRLDGYVHLRR